MAWDPDLFTIALSFVLRYRLELAIPIWMHAYSLTVAYSRRSNSRARFAFVAFCCISAGALAYLAYSYTYQHFGLVTIVPGGYLVASDLLSGKSRLLRNT
jgi:hypothetical protein